MSFREMRRFKQQITTEECQKVLKEANRLVISINGEDGYPYCLPMNFYYDETTNEIYLHGAMQGLFKDLIEINNKVCVMTYDEGYKVEGDWAWHLNSVIIKGKINLIEDPTHEILMKLGAKYYPDHQELVDLVNRAADHTQLYAITIEHMTGKKVHEK